MDERYTIVKNAIDASGFQSTATAAGYINPDIWNTTLLNYETSNLIVAQFGRMYNDLLNQPGEVLNVSVDAEPTSASALTESTDVTIDTLTFTQLTFTPTEYGAAYEVSDKEARRSFFSLMENITKKLGYRLAKKKDTIVINAVTTYAGNAVTANGVISSNITTSDTIDYDDIVNAKVALKQDKYEPKNLIICVEQEGQLMKLADFKQAYAFGGREVILNGMLGHAVGLDIYTTTQIPVASSKAKALLLGVNNNGEESFGICQKSNPKITTQYWARGRYTDFVAVEEYDVKVIHANGICTIESYAA